jgi:undecaprenyl diphosphate synthase
VFLDTLWPDVDRRTLWAAVEQYAQRDRRYGGAIDAASPEGSAPTSVAT